jgi:hypothetical protein
MEKNLIAFFCDLVLVLVLVLVLLLVYDKNWIASSDSDLAKLYIPVVCMYLPVFFGWICRPPDGGGGALETSALRVERVKQIRAWGEEASRRGHGPSLWWALSRKRACRSASRARSLTASFLCFLPDQEQKRKGYLLDFLIWTMRAACLTHARACISRFLPKKRRKFCLFIMDGPVPL